MNCRTRTEPAWLTRPHVVSAQIHEHHMLGTLLVVALQLLGQAEISSSVAPRGRAGKSDGGRVRPVLVEIVNAGSVEALNAAVLKLQR